jgi:hypothetical protein
MVYFLDESKNPSPGSSLSTLTFSNFIGAVPKSDSFPERSDAVQCELPLEVLSALNGLNEILSPNLNSSINQDAGTPIPLKVLAGGIEVEPIVKELIQQLGKWYFAEQAAASGFEPTSLRISEMLSEVVRHLAQVAESLKSDGYDSFSVNLTRNSFADELHTHTYCSYILYVGRESGTEIIPGRFEERGLRVREGRYDWSRNTKHVLCNDLTNLSFVTADVKRGLLLPPGVAHRAPRLIRGEGGSGGNGANLAVVLLAFKL